MNWKTKVSQNCTIFYTHNSFAEKNIDELLQKESRSIDKVCAFLQVRQKTPLYVYLYPTLAYKKKLVGGSSPGYSSFKDNLVGYVFNKSWSKNIATCHEETHIFCMLWGGRRVKLEGKIINSLSGLYEGLAMYTQSVLYYEYFYGFKQIKPPKGKTINESIIDDIKMNKAPFIFDVLGYEGYCKNLRNGAQLGSIVGYLMDTYGLETFKKIYLSASEMKTLHENIKLCERILGITANEINDKWKKYAIQNPHFRIFHK